MKVTKDRFFLRILSSLNDDGQDFLYGVYCLTEGKLCKLLFDYNEIDNTYRWYAELDLKSSKPVTNEETMLEEFVTSEDTAPGKNFRQYNRLEEIGNRPGDYFVRIYRPLFYINYDHIVETPFNVNDRIMRKLNKTVDYLPIDYYTMITGMTQLSVIIQNLKGICRTIHPESGNLNVYGHEIRDLLILTCTEIEAQLVGIYQANCPVVKKTYSTEDYVNLLPLLKLDSYVVEFSLYPWLQAFAPFKNWDKTKPTQSIPWYEAYNAVKHNREKEFSKASLLNLLEAIAGLYSLLNAQYGDHVSFSADLIGAFLRVSQKPSWEYAQRYLPPLKSEDWRPVKALADLPKVKRKGQPNGEKPPIHGSGAAPH
jgi:hypothetical protein